MTSGGTPLLLHAGQTAVQITTLDLRVTSVAVALLVAAAWLIWRPDAAVPLTRLLRRRHRRAGARAALTALVFLALLPSVLPYDHLLPLSAHAADEAQETVHVSHCHVAPATCSDAPVTAGPGQLLLNQPLVLVPAMLLVLLIALSRSLSSITPKPEIRPPLPAIAP